MTSNFKLKNSENVWQVVCGSTLVMSVN